MRDSVKKIMLALCAVSVMMFSATAFATSTDGTQRTTTTISANDTSSVTDTSDIADTDSDTVSEEESGTDTSGTTTAGSAASGVVQDSSAPVPTSISTGQQQTQTNVVQQAEAGRDAEKRYASKGALAVWIIISILINIIISFVIGNRFYKLAKKDTHVSAEVRALRRDLEDKFLNSVGGFTEMETDVTNTNDNYSMNGSIKMPERKSTDFAAESEDVFKRWESRMSQRRDAARQAEAAADAEPEDDFEEEEERRPRRQYRPSRARVEERDEDDYEDDDYEDDDVPVKVRTGSKSKAGSVKNKAKNILGDIFPFKED